MKISKSQIRIPRAKFSKLKSKTKLSSEEQIRKAISEIPHPPEFVTDPERIKKIKMVFITANLKMSKLKDITDPIKEKIARTNIFSQFEKQLEKVDFVISYQKIKNSKIPASGLFLNMLVKDYYYFVNKDFRTEETMSKLISAVNRKMSFNKYTADQLREYIERYYYESMYFIQGKIIHDSFKTLEKRVTDIPKEIRVVVTEYLMDRYINNYKPQIIEHNNSQKVRSDIIPNANANLSIRISFLEDLL
ncbi:MAG: hypothetical protein WC932_04600 [archaeon]|jgi:hypothetical protein